MTDARAQLTDADRQRIAERIAEAESKTAAEIVCAAATESGRYDRGESIVGLFAALVGLCVAHLINHYLGVDAAAGWGDGVVNVGLHLGWQSAAVAGGFIVGSVAASYVHPLRRLTVSENEMTAETERAAQHVFADAAVRMTESRTGLLVYVSLFERRVVIMADQKAREALGDDQIAALRDAAVEALRGGRLTDAFTAVLELASPTLREHLPADRQINANELADHVLTFHPRP